MAGKPPPLPHKGPAAGRRGVSARHYHHLGGLHESLENLGFTDLDSATVERLSSKFSPAVQSVIAAGALKPATDQQGNFSFDTLPRRGRNTSRTSQVFGGGTTKEVLYGSPTTASARRRQRRPPPPTSDRKQRLATERALRTATKGLDSHEKVELLEYALVAMDRDTDGFVSAPEAREALSRVGIVMSAADVVSMAANVGATNARDGHSLIDSERLVYELEARADDTVPPETRLGSSPGRLNARAASDRIVTRTLASAPSTRPAGDTTAFINKRHLTSNGATGVERAQMASRRFEAQQPGTGVVGLKETIFSDESAFKQREAPSLEAKRSSLIANKLLDRLVDHIPDKAALRQFSSLMAHADADADGALSLPQFQRCLTDVGLMVSSDDAKAIAEAVGAGDARSVFDTTHVSQSDVVRAVHAKLTSGVRERPPGVTGSSIHEGLIDSFGRPTRARRTFTHAGDSHYTGSVIHGTAGHVEDNLYDVRGHKMHSSSARRARDDKFAPKDTLDVLAPKAEPIKHRRAAGAARPMDPIAIGLAWSSSKPDLEAQDFEAAVEVRRRLRAALPADKDAARAVLRHVLRRVDGDRDGCLSITELNRGLRSVAGAAVSSADVVSVLRSVGKAFNVDTDPVGMYGSAASQTGPVYHADRGSLDIDSLASWFVEETGGHGVPDYSSRSWEWLARHGGHSQVPTTPVVGADGTSSQVVGAHLDGASTNGWSTPQWTPPPSVVGPPRSVPPARRGTVTAGERARFETFKVAWANKHGAAAARELRHDAARKPPGPTWTSANPQPFRVVKLSTPPRPPTA